MAEKLNRLPHLNADQRHDQGHSNDQRVTYNLRAVDREFLAIVQLAKEVKQKEVLTGIHAKAVQDFAHDCSDSMMLETSGSALAA